MSETRRRRRLRPVARDFLREHWPYAHDAEIEDALTRLLATTEIRGVRNDRIRQRHKQEGPWVSRRRGVSA